MEDVWKDINLVPLTERNNIHLTNTSNLQDFLSRPFSRDPPSFMLSPASETALYGSANSAPSGPRGATLLGLSSAPEFHLDPAVRSRNYSQRKFSSFISPTPFESSGCASSLPSSVGNKRPLAESDSSSEDRRNKRMIKNRESAARSRAKKQAYTSELELEIKHLSEENERLRRQQEQLREAAASRPKKNSLYRTFTAPF